MVRRQIPLKQSEIERGFEALGLATVEDRKRFEQLRIAPFPKSIGQIYVTRLSNSSEARGAEERNLAELERDSR